MAKVSQYANESLLKIQVQGSECPVEGDAMQSYIAALNDFMLSLEAKNVCLGYTVVEFPDDEVTVPAGAKQGIVANMAIMVSPDYGGVVTPELREIAIAGMKTIRYLGRCYMRSCMPHTLPIGSGNENYPNLWHFYPDRQRTNADEN